jgi:hypothetical protein
MSPAVSERSLMAATHPWHTAIASSYGIILRRSALTKNKENQRRLKQYYRDVIGRIAAFNL